MISDGLRVEQLEVGEKCCMDVNIANKQRVDFLFGRFLCQTSSQERANNRLVCKMERKYFGEVDVDVKILCSSI